MLGRALHRWAADAASRWGALRRAFHLRRRSTVHQRYLVDLPIDYTDGSRRSRGSREGFVEHFRIGADGKIKETQYQLASREAPFQTTQGRAGYTVGRKRLWVASCKAHGARRLWRLGLGRQRLSVVLTGRAGRGPYIGIR